MIQAENVEEIHLRNRINNLCIVCSVPSRLHSPVPLIHYSSCLHVFQLRMRETWKVCQDCQAGAAASRTSRKERAYPIRRNPRHLRSPAYESRRAATTPGAPNARRTSRARSSSDTSSFTTCPSRSTSVRRRAAACTSTGSTTSSAT